MDEISNGEIQDPAERQRVPQAALGGTATIPGPSPGSKRPHEAVEVDCESDADSDAPDGMEMDKNCDQVRTLIKKFIDNGGMKATEFQKTLNVSSKSYYSFLNQKGPYNGAGSFVYDKAWWFFKKREMHGVPMPAKKKAKTARAPLKDTTANSTARSNARQKAPGSETASVDISQISLPGEQSDSVPVYDTCNEIRKKINAHLKKDGVTAAALLRDISAQFKLAEKKITGSSLIHFRGQSGPDSGNTSAVFYGAYCFFEKLRIAQGKPKSNFRLEMEKVHGDQGMDTKRTNQWITCMAGSRPYVDKYGQVNVQRLF